MTNFLKALFHIIAFLFKETLIRAGDLTHDIRQELKRRKRS